VGFLSRLRTARRPGLPAEAAAALELEPGQRVLAWAALSGGGTAAATVEGLRVMTPRGRLVRRPWVDVDHAAWDEESATLVVWWVGSRQTTPLEVGEGSFLPEVVHERVRASVVFTREVALPGGLSATVALRKAADGALSTQVVAGRGVDTDDPQVAAVLARARAGLREDVGLAPDTRL
jgi:hypothetical protein